MLADFTIDGPIFHTLSELPGNCNHIAQDRETGGIFVVDSHDVFEINPKTGQRTELALVGDFPRLSWPCGITFDSKRRRLLVTSLGGEGFLYAQDRGTRKWSLVTSMKNRDLICMTYHPKHDLLYGLFQEHRSGAYLQAMTPEGVVQRWPAVDMPHFDTHDPDVQLVAVGDYVAALTYGREERRVKKPAEIRVFDPVSGKTIYHGTLRLHAGREDLTDEQISQLWNELLADDAKAADKSAWKLAAGGDAAVKFLAGQFARLSAEVDVDEVERLVKQLDDEAFQQRESAHKQLAALGPAIEEQLKKHVDHRSSEVRTRVGQLLTAFANTKGARPEDRQNLLGIAVLERVGTPAAIESLRSLAKNKSLPQLSRAAEAAEKRLTSETAP